MKSPAVQYIVACTGQHELDRWCHANDGYGMIETKLWSG